MRFLARSTFLVLGVLVLGCSSNKLKLAPGEERYLGTPVQLTSNFAKAGEAYFSPDMRWIIFQAADTPDGHYQMYLARLKWDFKKVHGPTQSVLPMHDAPRVPVLVGTDPPIRISHLPSRNTCGFFSPDNRSLIFASTFGKEEPNEPESGYQRQGHAYRWAYPRGMEIYRADDWQSQIRPKVTSVELHPTRLTDNDAYDAEGAYSPDGRWIVFTSNRTGDLELYAMHPDGTATVQLTHTKGYDGGAFFSPDGRSLVYRSDRKSNDLLQIFTADLVFDSSGNITGLAHERQLTHDNNVNWGPYWYLDGRHIIFATSAHGHNNYELYLVNSDGSDRRRVTYWPGFDGLPAFSPDGNWLMWTSKRSKDNTSQIVAARFTIDPAGR